MALTTKQEMFCQEVVKQPTYSAAYRIAYDASGMSDEVVNKEASILMSDRKIAVRVQQLKEKVADKMIYTLEQSMKRDISLIERYEAALDVLENDKSEPSQTEAAERTIRYIGSSAYNSAQDRLSKQSGWFKKHNKQKVEITDEDLDKRIAELSKEVDD